MHRCACISNLQEDAQRIQRRIATLNRASTAKADSDSMLCVPLTYHVLFSNTDNNVPLARIQSQHEMLNACFRMENTGIDHVPSVHPYNFVSVRGKANITFLPQENLSEKDVIRVQIPSGTKYASLESCVQALQSAGVTLSNKFLHAIIAPLDGFLGEAWVEHNTCVILDTTVGGDSNPAPLIKYNMGISLVHEMGHVLGLPHPFGDDCTQIFADVPPTKDGNYRFELVQVNDRWEGRNCGRYRDCKVYYEGDTSYVDGAGPYSCWDCYTSGTQCTRCDTETFEQGCNFMDYADDIHMVMFSKQQIAAMRRYLVSNDNNLEVSECTLTTTPSTASTSEPPSTISEQNATTPLTSTNGAQTTDYQVPENQAQKILGLPLWIFIPLVTVTCVSIILVVVYMVWKKSHPGV